ncbi:hypothetical protein [Deinococcus sp. LM3]|uniref:hypothetical protein n=1 Tax=Deinococcus sp. LM3 TaxID=1938608 RepID=UPI0009CBE37B|nr:hypothetical protein [Deinococcus sp. LM3]OOV12278.1 hypothetical protein BXU09_18465 [Deinococcus sp. LM3]
MDPFAVLGQAADRLMTHTPTPQAEDDLRARVAWLHDVRGVAQQCEGATGDIRWTDVSPRIALKAVFLYAMQLGLEILGPVTVIRVVASCWGNMELKEQELLSDWFALAVMGILSGCTTLHPQLTAAPAIRPRTADAAGITQAPGCLETHLMQLYHVWFDQQALFARGDRPQGLSRSSHACATCCASKASPARVSNLSPSAHSLPSRPGRKGALIEAQCPRQILRDQGRAPFQEVQAHGIARTDLVAPRVVRPVSDNYVLPDVPPRFPPDGS